MTEARIGANSLGNHKYTDWPTMLAVGRGVERLGYDTLWSRATMTVPV